MQNQKISALDPINLELATPSPDNDFVIQKLRQPIAEDNSQLRREVLTKALIIRELRQKVIDLEAQLKRKDWEALTDELTQVANRRAFTFGLSREWKRCRRENQPLSLLRIELDAWQHYNEAHGHLAGSKLLQDVAAAIVFCVNRPGDLAARLGEAKFGVILPNTPSIGARTTGQRILEFVRQVVYLPTDDRTWASVSIGSTSVIPNLTTKGKSPHVAIAMADQALYWATVQGGDQLIRCSEL